MKIRIILGIIGAVVGMVAMALLGAWVSGRVQQVKQLAFLKKPGEPEGDPVRWARLPGEQGKIAVKVDRVWQTRNLPVGVKASEVRSAATVHGNVRVEKNNAKAG